ncbi:Melibiase-domain-containing protein [Ochromonadaceae sp. CCMP2298]|nr:Melibiase-domain-containing protein [Ochromonadaceae sp. CCMP2298]
MSIDFEATSMPFHLVQMSGSWGRERSIVETRLSQGMRSFGSCKGVSGHAHNPFMAITLGAPSETTGEVRAFSFIYSGNYLMEAEVSEMGRLRCNVGINPMGLQWHLTPGQVFSTPEVVMVRSSEGLGGMSRSLHRLFLDRLLPRNWSDALPPILLNSWEAKYFHVNHSNIVEMATQASKIGINLIVLDDGWFGKRENDTCSLGDWVADLAKFPLGIKGLAEDVNAAGCKFGIWFEPEMVSEDSMLYTSHPDWYLHVPGRPRQLGRNQMVLDLSRAVVVDYLFHSLAAILGTANVEYVKWDMNRPLTEVYSAAPDMGDAWQAEVSHRYVLGVYQLMDRVTTAFPHILLENCASGGGRFDPGMLYYSPQIWCSDNTDALIRMKIQYGTSLAYPARSIGAHVSTVPNHITGSTTRLRTRGFVAMCGTFGYELDISTASAKDLMAWEAQINLYRALSPTIRWGDLYRLWDPFKVNLASWMYVSRDKSQAVVFAFSMNSDHWSNLVPRLLLQGLLPDAEYEITEPMPNNITQASGNLMIIETEGEHA